LYLELPAVTATPADRLQALKDSKVLLAGSPKTTTGFFAGSTEPTDAPNPDNLIRLAEYITTGHDYKDTHPEGKRRPVINQVTHVHVIAPPTLDTEDLEHFLHHVENGDFSEFLKDAMQAAEEEPAEEEPEADKPEDNRPSFS
jgi:hypothetical protein